MHAPRRVSGAVVIAICALLLACEISVAQSQDIAGLISRADAGEAAAAQQLLKFLLHADPAAPGFDVALAWLRVQAERDEPHAELLLGYLYEHRRGLPQDYTKAAANYQAAALHDDHSARNNLAFLYQRGLGVPRDPQRAYELYLAAAQQNDISALCNLATMYYTGSGVARMTRRRLGGFALRRNWEMRRGNMTSPCFMRKRLGWVQT